MFIIGSSDVAHAAAPAWASECAMLDDDAARLACYDSRNPPHKNATRTQSSVAHPPSPASAPAPRVTPDKDFGLAEQESARKKATEPTDMVARVDSVSQRLSGELLLKLDNGQSWVQTQRNSGVLIKAGERVTISRGALGGYLLSSDSGTTMRVRRLQ